MRHFSHHSIAYLALIAVIACGDNDELRDAIDSPTITITGHARTIRTSQAMTQEAVPDLTISAFRRFGAELATSVSDTQGNYTISIPLESGESFDGYLRATKSGFTTTYHFHPVPVSTDLVAPVHMMTTGNFDQIATSCSVSTDAGSAIIMILARDGLGPVSNVSIDTTPAAAGYCYNLSGVPSPTAETSDDGVAFALGVSAGTGAAILNATKTGVLFDAHIVNTFPESLTTTFITP